MKHAACAVLALVAASIAVPASAQTKYYAREKIAITNGGSGSTGTPPVTAKIDCHTTSTRTDGFFHSGVSSTGGKATSAADAWAKCEAANVAGGRLNHCVFYSARLDWSLFYGDSASVGYSNPSFTPVVSTECRKL